MTLRWHLQTFAIGLLVASGVTLLVFAIVAASPVSSYVVVAICALALIYVVGLVVRLFAES